MATPPDDIEVIHMTAVEWDQALTSSLDALGLTWGQLAEQAKAEDFSSLKARELWLMAGGQGPNQAEGELARWRARAEYAEDAAQVNRERANEFRQERDAARRERDEAAAELELFKPQPMSLRCREGQHNGVGDMRCIGCRCLCHNLDGELERQRVELARARRDAEAESRVANRYQAERNTAEWKLHKVAMVKVWTNEDGKRFVFADDLAGILLPAPESPAPASTVTS